MTTTRWIGTSGDLTAATNWDNAFPTAGASIVFTDLSLQPATANLDISTTALALAEIRQEYSGGYLGIAPTTSDAGYVSLSADAIAIGQSNGFGNASGASRVKLDAGTHTTTITVYNVSTRSEDAFRPPVRLLANNAATVVNVRRGAVGIGMDRPGETAVVGTVTLDQAGASVSVGSGVTLSTLELSAGQCALHTSAATVTQQSGTLVIDGDGQVTNMTVLDGVAIINNSGGVGTIEARGGTLDFTQTRAARTITTLKRWPGAVLRYDPDVVTFTNGIEDQAPMRVTTGKP